MGTANLVVKGVNAAAGYQALDERVSPDWSYNRYAYEDPASHNMYKQIGGTGLLMIVGAELGGGAGAAAGGTEAAIGLSSEGSATIVAAPAAAPVLTGQVGVVARAGVGVGSQIFAMSTPTDQIKEQLFEREGKPKGASAVRGAQTELAGGQTQAAIQQGRAFDHVTKVRNAQRGLVNRIGQINRMLGDATLSEADRAALQTELSEASKLLDMTKGFVPK